MVNVDLSKMVPRGSLSSISALIPGLFFEVSILIGNPQLIASHLASTQILVHLSPYLLLAIALFLAFIIGQASMLFVSFIQHALTYLHSLRLILTPERHRLASVPLLNRLAKSPFLARGRRFQDFRDRIINNATDPQRHAVSASRALHKLAGKLFRERYGVELGSAEEHSEWEALLWSVGILTNRNGVARTAPHDCLRGSRLVRAFGDDSRASTAQQVLHCALADLSPNRFAQRLLRRRPIATRASRILCCPESPIPGKRI